MFYRTQNSRHVTVVQIQNNRALNMWLFLRPTVQDAQYAPLVAKGSTRRVNRVKNKKVICCGNTVDVYFLK